MDGVAARRLKTFNEFLDECLIRKLKLNEATIQETTFYVYRVDTGAVLASGIEGFDAAKEAANRLRQKHGLRFDNVRFRKMGGIQGRTFVDNRGKSSPIEYSRSYNPSKGRRFRGYTDADGNYHDID